MTGCKPYLKAAGAVLATALLVWVSWSALNRAFPLPDIGQRSHAVNVRAEDHETLRQFADNNGVFRTPVDVSQVSPVYISTLLAYEDQQFYSHPGVDPAALIRAAGQRLIHGRIISGGSTITMQVARLLYDCDRSYAGKLVQIFRALQLEQRYSKDEILSLYLTYAPMGGNIEGAEAASQRYFGKSARLLNVSEAALLTVLPQRPSVYRPDRYPERAFKARNKILERLVSHQLITPAEYQLLSGEAVVSRRLPIKRDVPLLARELKKRWENESDISTFINARWQASVSSLIARRFSSLDSDLSVATLVMENETGRIRVYKGSLDIESTRSYGHVDMTKAVRSPGSTLKPFIYAMALDDGLIHSESLLTDIPLSFGDYKPQNFNHRFQGEISASEALQRSKNVAPVRLLSHIGVPRFTENMEVLGSSLRLSEANLTVALGGGGSTLRELVMYYSALARAGEAIKPRFTAHDPQEQARLMSPESAWIVKAILQDIRPPDRARSKFGRKIGWKTGTSYGFRDAWAIGVSADYTVGVWVGRPDGSPYVGQTGATMAAPLLFDVFDLLPDDMLTTEQPESVQATEICWPSGLNARLVREPDCHIKRTAWTIDGLTPRTLRRDNQPENLHKWPQSLKSWRQQLTINSPTIDIISPEDGSYIYPYPGQLIELKASSDEVRWYLDDKVSEDKISAESLSGRHKITACNPFSCSEVFVSVY